MFGLTDKIIGALALVLALALAWQTYQLSSERTEHSALKLQVAQDKERLPPPRVLDMASSHAWNFGPGATCNSQAMEAWNRGEWVLGCERISKSDAGRPVWSSVSYYEGGVKKFKFVQGLANRRADESAKCAEGF